MLRQVVRHAGCAGVAPRAGGRAALLAPVGVRHGGDGFNVHRDTEYNNPDTPFEFSDVNYKRVDEILAKYPPQYKRSAIMPLLDLAQRQVGWLPLAAMNKVATICEVEPMRVYEVATFYSMYHRQPVGKTVVGVCTTTPCELCGSADILAAAKKHLGIGVGETTPDGAFTLLEVECAGACVNAPVVAMGDDYYENLTPESIVKVIDSFKSGKPLPHGPQTAQRGCEGPQGKTSLFGEPSGPQCRDLAALKKEREAAQAAKAKEAKKQ